MVDGGTAGTGDGLVRIDDDSIDGIDAVDGGQGHDHLNGGAVGASDDPVMVAKSGDHMARAVTRYAQGKPAESMPALESLMTSIPPFV